MVDISSGFLAPLWLCEGWWRHIPAGMTGLWISAMVFHPPSTTLIRRVHESGSLLVLLMVDDIIWWKAKNPPYKLAMAGRYSFTDSLSGLTNTPPCHEGHLTTLLTILPVMFKNFVSISVTAMTA
ncbi:hypothetical protein L195_g013016 [Trifolium pratense]|uniref:Uncharacterized protein n=1 Tax=Trifolium pratense TaxID=57577 RepID=A0A2K3PLY6_TRIPR|nr:hypothetical protein L195_g013016 [Trifolium pratense]